MIFRCTVIPFILFILLTVVPQARCAKPLKGVTLCIDPGHGNTAQTDFFRVGPTGEREEWINLRVAFMLRDLLLEAGATVLMTRESDIDVNLADRAALAVRHDADLFVSIHHNGTTNDPDVDTPLIYFWGKASENPASVDFGSILIEKMVEKMQFEDVEGAGLYSDFVLFSEGTAVLRNSYPHLPGVIGEAGYFTNAAAEARMKDPAHNRAEAEAYYEAILEYVKRGLPKATLIKPAPGEVLDATQPEIVFQLNDGLGGWDFQQDTLRIRVNGEEQNIKWDPQTGQMSCLFEGEAARPVTVTAWGRNARGNALHPRQWTVRTHRAMPEPVLREWRTAYDEGSRLDGLARDASDNREIAVHLDRAIESFQRSLEVFSHHPLAASAEFQIGSAYDRLYRIQKAPELKAKAVEHYRRVWEFYPDSSAAEAARKDYEALISS